MFCIIFKNTLLSNFYIVYFDLILVYFIFLFNFDLIDFSLYGAFEKSSKPPYKELSLN